MIASLAELLLLLAPLVAGGVGNQLYLRLAWVRRRNAPLDGGRCWRDGRALLGPNKTWQGVVGMVGLTALAMAGLSGLAGELPALARFARMDYAGWAFPGEPLLYGALWGLGYVLFELPNSFVKRRLGVPPGGNVAGLRGQLLRGVDQADSVIGCLLVMPVFYVPSAGEALAILVLGSAVHYAINLALYGAGLKGQAG